MRQRAGFLIGLLCLMAPCLHADPWWQPEGLQKNIVQKLVEHIEATTPYRVHIDHIGGNFFKVFTLEGVAVHVEGKKETLVAIRSIEVDLRWAALLKKRIEIQKLIFMDPVVRLNINKAGHVDLPVLPPSDKKEEEPSWSIQRLSIQKGQLAFTNYSAVPTQKVGFSPIHLEAQVTPERLTIQKLQAALVGGKVTASGHVALTDMRDLQLTLQAQSLPLHQLAKIRTAPPPSLRLHYSGQWRIQSQKAGWKALSQGRLENAALTMNVRGGEKGWKTVALHLEPLALSRLWISEASKDAGTISAALEGTREGEGWEKVHAKGSLHVKRTANEKHPEQRAEIILDVAQGKGPIHATIASEGLAGSATAQINLVDRLSKGEFQIVASSMTGLAELASELANAEGLVQASGSWEGPWDHPSLNIVADGKSIAVGPRRLKEFKGEVSGVWRAKEGLRLSAELKELQWNSRRENAWDLTTLRLSATSANRQWKPEASVEFKNKATLEYSGSYESRAKTWKVTADKLLLKPAEGPTLEAKQPAEVVCDENGAIEIHGLVLASGDGRLDVSRARYQKPNIDVAIQSNDWDPSVFSVLSKGSQIDAGGVLKLHAQIQGPFPKVEVDGELTAAVPRVRIPELGLDMRQLDVSIVSHKKDIEIKRFTAKTKKGKIDVAGKSTLPLLDFHVLANRLEIKKPKHIDARGDVDLHIGGDLAGPSVTGNIHLSKGTYRVPQETKKQKAARKKLQSARRAEEPSTIWMNTVLDVHGVWPRDVWYRDGLSKIETHGDLRIQKEKGMTTLYLTGTISILRGSYDAFGRDFSLTSGDIAFTGPPEINPILNIQAEYKSAGTVVYLDVQGTAKAPELSLRSNPPLPQQDIVSVLVLGRPLNEIRPNTGSPDSSSSDEAEALAGSVLSTMITRQLRENGLNLGLDVVRVEPTTQGNVLKVGRYIGPDVYVAYGQPLQATAARAYEANYYFTPHWTLVGESGMPDTAQATSTTIDNHIAVEFRYPLNKPRR